VRRGGAALNSTQLLPAIRDLYSRLPETYHLEPWELQSMLYLLNYIDDLADEADLILGDSDPRYPDRREPWIKCHDGSLLARAEALRQIREERESRRPVT
jgi:hypothetical protein